jgi:hypothetical protein
MSRVQILSAEELMQPVFAGSGRRFLDLGSDADFLPEFCSVPAAIRSRPGVRSLTRSPSEDKKYCLKNSAVINAAAWDEGCRYCGNARPHWRNQTSFELETAGYRRPPLVAVRRYAMLDSG